MQMSKDYSARRRAMIKGIKESENVLDGHTLASGRGKRKGTYAEAIDSSLIESDVNRKRGFHKERERAFYGRQVDAHNIEKGYDTYILNSMKNLEEAYHSLNSFDEHGGSEAEYTTQVRESAQKIANRAKRLYDAVKKDIRNRLGEGDEKTSEKLKYVIKESHNLIDNLDEHYGVTPKGNTLESAVVSVLGLGLGIFFLFPNITGNVIGSITRGTSNMIGSALLVIGIIASFFYVKNR